MKTIGEFSMKVKKAIIPAGGLGTRWLPITKSIPKELIPINLKPMIQYVVEEAVNSGIKEILIIINRHKEIIKHYFTGKIDKKLESRREIKNLRHINERCKILFSYQKSPKGLMDAISYGENFVKNEPFAVLLPDNIMISRIPCIKQLIDTFNVDEPYAYIVLKKFIGGVDTGEVDIGSVSTELLLKDIYKIKNVKKKKKRIVILKKGEVALKNFGRYIFPRGFFDYIKKHRTEYRGEFDDTPILARLASEGKLLGKLYNGIIFDTGNVEGFSNACLYFIKHSYSFKAP